MVDTGGRMNIMAIILLSLVASMLELTRVFHDGKFYETIVISKSFI